MNALSLPTIPLDFGLIHFKHSSGVVGVAILAHPKEYDYATAAPDWKI